jgi:hypothetical protein
MSFWKDAQNVAQLLLSTLINSLYRKVKLGHFCNFRNCQSGHPAAKQQNRDT